jgi:hypothetical protein
MPLALAASNVEEALAEIEHHRDLIAELMHWGQPTEAAEQALESMFRQFAWMIELEHAIIAEALQTKLSARRQRKAIITDPCCLEVLSDR